MMTNKSKFSTLSIIGMCKNSGKTTVLNNILQQERKPCDIVAVTSIGRDGENKDVVTNTHKPEIYVRKDTIIATAKDLLCHCDITKEILDTTDINTPMGKVVLVRALSDGYVQLAGPSINKQVAAVIDMFKQLGANKVIVDGALGRKTTCSPAITDKTLLCTGAALNKDITKVVEDTAHVFELLTLDAIDDIKVREIISDCNDDEKIILIYENYEYKKIKVQTIFNSFNKIIENISPETKYIYLKGAILDDLISKIITSNMKFNNLNIIANDGSKLFISKTNYNKLKIKKCKIYVQNKINVLAVAINPESPYGYKFDKHEFKNSLQQKVNVPVINVREENINWL